MTTGTRATARPTVFGVVVVVLLVVAAVVRPPVADPSVTGLVWSGLLGAVLLGIGWPLLTVRLMGIRVVAAPTDLVVGQLGTLELELTGRASGLSIGATGSGAVVVDIVAPGRIRVPFTVARRGAYQQVRIDVGSDAPFGVLLATRSRLVALPRQLLVGPVASPVDVRPAELAGDLAEPMPAGAGSTGEAVRSVRPYVTGDPSHLVHWPSTARTGSLVVRELEPPASRGMAIVVDLGAAGAGAAADSVAARAVGAARSVREQGGRVLLSTCEWGGPVLSEAPDELAVQRRIALATGGSPPAAPDGWPTIRLAVDTSSGGGAPA